MNEYDIKRGHFEKIEGGKLETMMENIFGNAKKNGEKLTSSSGRWKTLQHGWMARKRSAWRQR